MVVVNAPVGIRVILLPKLPRVDGGVMVAIAAVPEIKAIGVVGAIVVALAMVGAEVVEGTGSTTPLTLTTNPAGE